MPIDIGGGNYITKIPALSEDADIQEALKLYHFGDGIEPEKSIVAHLSRIEAEAIGTRVLNINTLSGVGNNLDNITQSGFYVQSNAALAQSPSYPSVGGQRYPGLLTVTNGSPSQVGSDIVYQEYNATSASDLSINFKFIRRRFPDANNQPRWSEWKRLVSPDDHNHDTLYFRREQIFNLNELPSNAPFTYTRREIDAKFLTPEQLPQSIPVGAMMIWPDDDNSVPAGWVACNGNSYDVSDPLYENLFNVLGYKYGSVSGGAQFRVPNLRGRVPVGPDNLDSDFAAFGQTGGSKTHTLTEAQMPSHTHSGSTDSGGAHSHSGSTSTAGDHGHNSSIGSAGSHSHTGSVSGATGNTSIGHSHSVSNIITNVNVTTANRGNNITVGNTSVVTGVGVSRSNVSTSNVSLTHSHGFSANFTTSNEGGHTHSISIAPTGAHSHNFNTSNTGAHTHGISVQSSGLSQPHNNLQPYIVLNYIIKL
jgi:microcystin-dependent protein